MVSGFPSFWCQSVVPVGAAASVRPHSLVSMDTNPLRCAHTDVTHADEQSERGWIRGACRDCGSVVKKSLEHPFPTWRMVEPPNVLDFVTERAGLVGLELRWDFLPALHGRSRQEIAIVKRQGDPSMSLGDYGVGPSRRDAALAAARRMCWVS
jgi:hypothetical protein